MPSGLNATLSTGLPWVKVKVAVRCLVLVSHRPTWPPESPAARVRAVRAERHAVNRAALGQVKVAVRCLVPVSHRPIWPSVSPAARVVPSGLNATLSTAAALGQGGGPAVGAGVPQADIAVVVADGEGRAVRAERHADDRGCPAAKVAVRCPVSASHRPTSPP